MITVVTSISSLLLGIGTLLVGVGFLGTLLGVRAGIEGFSEQVTGLVMSAYFAGYILGTWACPSLIRRVGHIRAFAAMAAVASVCVTAHALWVHPVVWGVLRVISGACLVGLYIVIESWLNVLAPNQKRGKMLSVYMMTTLLAMAGGQYLILVADPAAFMPFGIIAMLVSLGLLGLFAVYRMRTGAPIPAAEQGEFVSLVRTTPEAVELLPEAEVEPELDLPVPPPESTVEPEALRPTGTD